MRVGELSPTSEPTAVIEVAISRTAGDAYRVEVLRSPAGEAAEVVNLDLVSLAARRKQLRQAILASAAGGSRPADEEPLRATGRQLFAALLGAGNVARLYRNSTAMAVGRGQQLRVVLRTDDPALAVLPWEAMYDEADGRYVCREQPLVRHVNVALPVMPLPAELPLRVLAVISSPVGLPELNVDSERRLLAGSLARLVSERRAELVWAPSASWAHLHETLLHGPWHVLHFVGHGRFMPGSGEGELALAGPTGALDWVEASKLVDLLGRARPLPRLVVLNSCSGAAMSDTGMFSSTAAALTRGGVSAVAAMQYEVSDPAAVAFTRGFYSELAHGRGVDDAVWGGRTAVIGLNSRTMEWVTPVLYLRGDDSRLFPPLAEHRPVRPDGPGPGETARPLGTLARHAAAARCLAFSPSQKLLASAGDDPDIQLWQVPAGVNVRAVRVGPHPVTSLAFSPDGKLLVSAGAAARFLTLWETSSGKRVRRLAGHTAGVMGVAFSPDGQYLASAGSDQMVRLWSVATGESQVLAGHTAAVRSVAFSPDGKWLISGSSDRTVRLWPVPIDGDARILRPPADTVTCVAFSPDLRLLAAAAGAAIHLWNFASCTMEGTLSARTGLVHSMAFHPEEPMLASGGADAMVRLWDLHSGEMIQSLGGHESAVTDVKFSPDGSLLASAGADHTIRLWEVLHRDLGTPRSRLAAGVAA